MGRLWLDEYDGSHQEGNDEKPGVPYETEIDVDDRRRMELECRSMTSEHDRCHSRQNRIVIGVSPVVAFFVSLTSSHLN